MCTQDLDQHEIGTKGSDVSHLPNERTDDNESRDECQLQKQKQAEEINANTFGLQFITLF